MRALLTVMLISGCQTIIPEPNVDCDTAAYPSVNVRVQDGSGELIPDAEVVFSLGDTEATPCESFANGTYVCGWERAGPIDIQADAFGYEPNATNVVVEQGECHVVTQEVTITLTPVNCPEILTYAVNVEPVDADGNAITRARVEAMPFGENWTSPEPCEPFGPGSWACGPDWTGEVEIWVTARGVGSFYDVVDVPFDECGPITQTIRPVVDRNPG